MQVIEVECKDDTNGKTKLFVLIYFTSFYVALDFRFSLFGGFLLPFISSRVTS